MVPFDAQFTLFYRENSFLSHPLVPTEVKTSRSPTFVSHQLNWKDGALDKLRAVTSHVLVFDNLYEIGLEVDAVFQERINDGFKSSSYRQL